MHKHLLPTAAVLALVSTAAGAATATFTAFSGAVSASAGVAAPAGSLDAAGTGPAGSDGGSAVGGLMGGAETFNVPHNGTLFMYVQDGYTVGDVDEAFLDGSLLGTTGTVQLNGTTAQSCTFNTNPSTADNSCGTFSAPITAGSHSFNIEDILLQYMGMSDPYGGGTVTASLNPAGLFVSIFETYNVAAGVPEPASLAVLGAGLLGAGIVRRRRARAG